MWHELTQCVTKCDYSPQWTHWTSSQQTNPDQWLMQISNLDNLLLRVTGSHPVLKQQLKSSRVISPCPWSGPVGLTSCWRYIMWVLKCDTNVNGNVNGTFCGTSFSHFFLDLKSFIYVYLSSLHLISSNVPKLSWIGLLCGTGSCLAARHFEMLRTLRGKSTANPFRGEFHGNSEWCPLINRI